MFDWHPAAYFVGVELGKRVLDLLLKIVKSVLHIGILGQLETLFEEACAVPRGISGQVVGVEIVYDGERTGFVDAEGVEYCGLEMTVLVAGNGVALIEPCWELTYLRISIELALVEPRRAENVFVAHEWDNVGNKNLNIWYRVVGYEAMRLG